MRSTTLILLFLFSRIHDGLSRLMVTQYEDLIHWTCFGSLTASACCKDIETAAAGAGYSSPSNCERLVAEVPDVPVLRDYDMAQYSLVVNHNRSEIVSESSILQHRWEEEKLTERTSPTSPFFWGAIKKVSQAIELQSILSQEGGMHRQMTSTSAGHWQGFGSYFLVIVVPESMFVDLDDFVENSKSTIHATMVCDIEKPSFLSRQHVIVLEVHNDSTLILRTKWHVRYPEPSQRGVALVQNLPEPHGFLMKDDALYYSQHFARLPDVFASAGYGQDFYPVLWGTMIACWVGVWKMLTDISSISYWDP